MKKTEISIRPTPNPNAIKVLLKTLVKTDGKSTYKSPLECSHNPFACALFTVRGISRIHFFQNVITVTKTPLDEWEAIEPELLDCIVERFHDLDPNLEDPDAAFMTMVTRYMPIGAVGLIFAVLIAALVSTLDSGLNSFSTILMPSSSPML